MERMNKFSNTTKKQGDIWFDSIRDGDKGRPLLLISKQLPLKVVDLDAQVSTITTHSVRDYRDVEIDWQSAGLNRKSIVRTSKINTIPSSNLEYRIGRLSSSDLENVIEVVRSNY
jgi:mRNA-degrading endonuclease toxin of MazEF toxin-antitoxin module